MKIYSALAAAAMSLVIMDSCTETVEVDAGLDKSRLENTVALTGSFKVLNNPRMRAVEIHEQPVTLQLQATLSNSHDAIAEFIFTAATDDDLVSAYNSAHETDFPGLPVENVKIEDDGLIAIAPGDRLSYEFDMTVSPDGLQQGRTYVLPVRTVSNTPEVKVTDRDTVQYFLFSMQGQRPSAAKESGIVSICYIESMSEYVRIHLEKQDEPVVALGSLTKLEGALPAHFMRVHRSYIVNLHKIVGVLRQRIIMDRKVYIPVGENYRESFNDYISRRCIL